MARKNLLEAKLAQLRTRRWKKADAHVVVEALERSGDSVAAFARTHELNAQKIFWWRSQLAKERREGGEVLTGRPGESRSQGFGRAG